MNAWAIFFLEFFSPSSNILQKNELPRRKQRGITKNLDYGRRKRRGIRLVEAVPKALLESLIFFTINFNCAFGTAPIDEKINKGFFSAFDLPHVNKKRHLKTNNERPF